ncbi:hypothetical protein HWV62_21908 [Athelia sp. TMB]|nr:hypothetical protein HWV62_21908 [Athelia sp. TMB]
MQGPVEDASDDEESAAAYAQRTKSINKTKKAVKGALRDEVDSVRTVFTSTPAASVASKKRKHLGTGKTLPSANFSTDIKRSKKERPQGLMANWRRVVADAPEKRATAKESRPTLEVEAPATENEAGFFDEDEALDLVNVARTAKSSIKIEDVSNPVSKIRSQDRRTNQMSVHVIAASSTMQPGKKQGKKLTFTNADLPFPASIAATCQRRWRKMYKPSTLDPFGTNSDLGLELACIDNWKKDEKQKAVIIGVTQTVFTQWRSAISKHATSITVLKKSFDNDLNMKHDKECRAAFVKWALDDVNFIYRYPDDEDKGPFQSDVVLETFAYHLKQTRAYGAWDKVDENYGRPTGGLALCCAAMERALTAYKTGDYLDHDITPDGKHISNRFDNARWGGPTRTWRAQLVTMPDELWQSVIGDASPLLSSDDDLDAQPDEQLDPRSQVVF